MTKLTIFIEMRIKIKTSYYSKPLRLRKKSWFLRQRCSGIEIFKTHELPSISEEVTHWVMMDRFVPVR